MIEWIGILAGILTTTCYIPQAMHVIRERNTGGISLLGYSTLFIGVFLWLIYGLLIWNLPLLLANGISLPLISAVLIMKIRHVLEKVDAPAPYKTAYVGSFIICYGKDSSTTQDPVILLIKRADGGLGIPGGYTELGKDDAPGEQPREGAVRELKEEVLDNTGKPILSPDSARLRIITSGLDYRTTEHPTHYNGHALELNASELSALREHARKLQKDTAYQAAVKKQSQGEISGLLIVPVSDIMKMKRESFTYAHEFDALLQLAETLKRN